MTDRIIFQKLSLPISPMQKVTRLKREDQDSEKRRFQRQFEEVEDEEKTEDQISLESKTQDLDYGKKRREGVSLKDDEEELRPRKEKDGDNDTMGSLVDIHV